MNKRLYRSKSDEMLGGVCGGLGEYFGLDSNLIRLIFVVLAIPGGVGVLAYLALWLIVPLEGEAKKDTAKETLRSGANKIAEKARSLSEEARTAAHGSNVHGGVIIGAVLVVLGIVFLLRNFGFVWMYWFSFGKLWPLLLVICGVMLLWHRRKGD